MSDSNAEAPVDEALPQSDVAERYLKHTFLLPWQEAHPGDPSDQLKTLTSGTEGPILEIGTGKGRFIVDHAMSHPEDMLLGVERDWKWLKYAAEKVVKKNLKNVFLCHGMVQDVLEAELTDWQFKAIYILFPDPWPKKKHWKRRLAQENQLKDLLNVLKPGGKLILVTDHQDYDTHAWRACKKLADQNLCQLERGYPDMALSNYHRKYLQEGRDIYGFTAEKPLTSE